MTTTEKPKEKPAPQRKVHTPEERRIIKAKWTRELAALVDPYHLTDDDFDYLMLFAEQKQLNPLHQFYVIPYVDNATGNVKITPQVGIDGLRMLAEMSGKYVGMNGPWYCGPDAKWVDVWVDEEKSPVACKCEILRSDHSVPTMSVARFKEFNSNNKMWKKLDVTMLTKVTMAQGFRRAFPSELSGVYSPDEMDQREMPDRRDDKADTIIVDPAPEAPVDTNGKKLTAKQRKEAEAWERYTKFVDGLKDAQSKATMIKALEGISDAQMSDAHQYYRAHIARLKEEVQKQAGGPVNEVDPAVDNPPQIDKTDDSAAAAETEKTE